MAVIVVGGKSINVSKYERAYDYNDDYSVYLFMERHGQHDNSDASQLLMYHTFGCQCTICANQHRRVPALANGLSTHTRQAPSTDTATAAPSVSADESRLSKTQLQLMQCCIVYYTAEEIARVALRYIDMIRFRMLEGLVVMPSLTTAKPRSDRIAHAYQLLDLLTTVSTFFNIDLNATLASHMACDTAIMYMCEWHQYHTMGMDMRYYGERLHIALLKAGCSIQTLDTLYEKRAAPRPTCAVKDRYHRATSRLAALLSQMRILAPFLRRTNTDSATNNRRTVCDLVLTHAYKSLLPRDNEHESIRQYASIIDLMNERRHNHSAREPGWLVQALMENGDTPGFRRERNELMSLDRTTPLNPQPASSSSSSSTPPPSQRYANAWTRSPSASRMYTMLSVRWLGMMSLATYKAEDAHTTHTCRNAACDYSSSSDDADSDDDDYDSVDSMSGDETNNNTNANTNDDDDDEEQNSVTFTIAARNHRTPPPTISQQQQHHPRQPITRSIAAIISLVGRPLQQHRRNRYRRSARNGDYVRRSGHSADQNHERRQTSTDITSHNNTTSTTSTTTTTTTADTESSTVSVRDRNDSGSEFELDSDDSSSSGDNSNYSDMDD